MEEQIKKILETGAFIPAHPLALQADLSIDEAAQRRLTRYYIKAGVDGVAVGVHTTQFEIRLPQFNYYEKVLQLAADEIDKTVNGKPFIKIAGICGKTEQALEEAALAVKQGYHMGLLSMGGLATASEESLLQRTREVAGIIPVFGFYLQPAVGGRVLSYDFWRSFADIENVRAIKIAAFNRYQTIDVVRAVCESDRRDEIVLYTGNDDNIIADLLTPYEFSVEGKKITKTIVGGLLGHYSVWTKSAVDLFRELKEILKTGEDIRPMLQRGIDVTAMNAALFDVQHNFKGSISGIHEVLRRQGLMKGVWCLAEQEQLSPGQTEALTRVSKQYKDLTDDDFVKAFLENERS